MSIEIESEDVIRLILQFLKENKYDETLHTLEQETNVKVNTLENKEDFISEIKKGEWDKVLRHVADLKLPAAKLLDLYEQVVLELAEMRELSAARTLLRQTEPMYILKQRQPERYLKLEHTLSRSVLDPKEHYPQGMTKEKRRQIIAQGLASEVNIVEPSRLMSLLEDCIKWQRHQGLLKTEANFDVFSGSAVNQQIEDEACVNDKYKEIKMPGKNTYAECTIFSPNGLHLVSGSVDGFIEVWNPVNGKLRKDLKYQAEENLMAMDQAVICLCFSTDSEILASGSTDGKIAIWKIQSGLCTKRFSPAHSQGVTCIRFNRDASEILSSSYDHTIKIHKVKSGELVKLFEGHTSFVNSVMYSSDNTTIISGSNDGTVKIWDYTTGACLHSIKAAEGIFVQQVLTIPGEFTKIVAIYSNNSAAILSDQGLTLKLIKNKSESNFVSGVVSHQGSFLYILSEDSFLHCYDIVAEKFLSHSKVCDDEVIGISAHPSSNVIAINNDKRRIFLYKHTSLNDEQI
ncbi:putative smu-1 suppressor of mec-8 and unc-52 [Mycotypha africana]|uniref:putative smu-1 suppressor of mec-8 and unc-52 n=1 Tax=Mycotypha africana TaxID=64632 RepID=UPI002301E0D2|nr:putative smu-1 suppressor of mec-8 and unc-52 [Mycotypha africana]KAI8973419.1 putative smu-1 suppressor of mec-8 and unc-52 [Mycotypha africana]